MPIIIFLILFMVALFRGISSFLLRIFYSVSRNICAFFHTPSVEEVPDVEPFSPAADVSSFLAGGSHRPESRVIMDLDAMKAYASGVMLEAEIHVANLLRTKTLIKTIKMEPVARKVQTAIGDVRVMLESDDFTYDNVGGNVTALLKKCENLSIQMTKYITEAEGLKRTYRVRRTVAFVMYGLLGLVVFTVGVHLVQSSEDAVQKKIVSAGLFFKLMQKAEEPSSPKAVKYIVDVLTAALVVLFEVLFMNFFINLNKVKLGNLTCLIRIAELTKACLLITIKGKLDELKIGAIVIDLDD